MENKFTTENLKVGDKVKVYCSNQGVQRYYVGEIVKKTPTGLVDVQYKAGYAPVRFRATGGTYEKSALYSRSYSSIDYLTPEDEILITEQNESIAMVRWLKEFEWSKLSHGELTKVCATVKDLKNS